MNKTITPHHTWCTAAQSDATACFHTDLASLGAHLNGCPQVHRHLLTWYGARTFIHGFVTTRLVTTLVMVAALVGLGYWVL